MSAENNRKPLFLPLFIRVSFYIYALLMFWEIFLGPYRTSSAERRYNLVPFRTILSLVKNYSYYNPYIWFINLVGNVITFIPLGFLLPLIFPRTNNIKKIVLVSFMISLAAESLQLLFNVGIFDVDDLTLNILGGAAGFGLYLLFNQFRFSRKAI